MNDDLPPANYSFEAICGDAYRKFLRAKIKWDARMIKENKMELSERDYQLPWERGIGNDACKIWDANDRLVCIMETSNDSTFLVESINKVAQLEAKLAAHLENEGDECPLCQLEAELEQEKQIAWNVIARGIKLEKKLEETRNREHLNAAKVLSRDALLKGASEEYKKIEADNAALREYLDEVSD